MAKMIDDIMEGMRNEYHRYDIIEAEIKMTTPSGSVQKQEKQSLKK